MNTNSYLTKNGYLWTIQKQGNTITLFIRDTNLYSDDDSRMNPLIREVIIPINDNNDLKKIHKLLKQ